MPRTARCCSRSCRRPGSTRILPADGAFYLYVDVSDFTADSVAFTRTMLDEIGIAATPGVDFDAERGGRYVRFCYAGTTADMAEAARPLAKLDGASQAPSDLRCVGATCRRAPMAVHS